jgi:hypothetical protein
VDNWRWLAELEKTFDLAAEKVLDRFHYYEEQIQMAVEERKFSRAEALQKIKSTIYQRDLINFFGQHNVLPKYGFPVDVVELITDYVHDEAARRVELQRDLRMAISEFAPGSSLVAAKRVWTGGGLYKLPDRGWEPIAFAICPECSRFNTQIGDQPIAQCQCGRNLPPNASRVSGIMIKPEYGFLAAPEVKDTTEARPSRNYTSRVYFHNYDQAAAASAPENEHQEEARSHLTLTRANITVATRYSRFGELVLVNHGPDGWGFHICPMCGHGQPIPDTAMTPSVPGSRRRGSRSRQTLRHKNPRNGRDCPAENLMQRRLGHSFITDVLEIRLTGMLPMQHLFLTTPDEKDLWFT